MKRYTLQFQPLYSSITTVDFREEVEQVLLRLHPRITYKMGKVFQDVDGNLLAEFAADGQRDLLTQAIESRTWSLPVRFLSLRWGWSIENEDAALQISSVTPLDANPVAGIQPLEGMAEYHLSKWHTFGRYIALIGFTIVMVLLLIANAIHTNYPVLEWVYVVGFAVWMFTLNETPFDYRVYARSIHLQQAGLEVEYWLGRAPQHLDWASISGMDYSNPVCMLIGQDKRMRFLLSERFGCKEKPVVLKTIVARAGLSYVEGNFQKLIYRKPEAR